MREELDFPGGYLFFDGVAARQSSRLYFSSVQSTILGKERRAFAILPLFPLLF